MKEHEWMAEWLEAFLETNADDLASRDLVVLDRIREHLATTRNRENGSRDA